jgi:hypothetical protein
MTGPLRSTTFEREARAQTAARPNSLIQRSPSRPLNSALPRMKLSTIALRGLWTSIHRPVFSRHSAFR